MKKKYKTEALQVIHEDMKSMNQIGIISDEKMRKFDKMCLSNNSPKSDKINKFPIKKSTKAESISHQKRAPVFASQG